MLFQKWKQWRNYWINKERWRASEVEIDRHRIGLWHVDYFSIFERFVENWSMREEMSIVDTMDYFDLISIWNHRRIDQTLSCIEQLRLFLHVMLDGNYLLWNKFLLSLGMKGTRISNRWGARLDKRQEWFLHFDQAKSHVREHSEYWIRNDDVGPCWTKELTNSAKQIVFNWFPKWFAKVSWIFHEKFVLILTSECRRRWIFRHLSKKITIGKRRHIYARE